MASGCDQASNVSLKGAPSASSKRLVPGTSFGSCVHECAGYTAGNHCEYKSEALFGPLLMFSMT